MLSWLRTIIILKNGINKYSEILHYAEIFTTTDDGHINPFFLSMLGNITRHAVTKQFDVLVSFQYPYDDWASQYQASNRADGTLI